MLDMINNKDYLVVVNAETNKKVLIKVTDNKNQIGKIIDKSAAYSSTKQDVAYDDTNILAYLGPNPQFGNVFGVKVEPYRKKLELQPYGMIYFFRKVNDAETKILVRDLEACAKNMKKWDLDHIFPLDVEIREKSGIYVGTAKTSYNKDGDLECVMTLKPHSFSDSLRPTIYHEFGHFLWYTKVSEKYKAKWLEKYVKNVKVSKADKHIIEVIKDDISKNGIGALDDYNEDYDDVASAMLDYVRDYHTLTRQQLELLEKQDYDILHYFPSHVQLVDQEAIVTEYANKSVEEFFAESFMFWATGQQLPKELDKLMQKTYDKIKGI